MKVSVIIPVYKTEQYIERCARSLFEQTMTEGIEYIFIDDATPDNAIFVLEQIVSQYPLLHNQIRILHNAQNFGITLTRKRGLAESKGEYIAWVDSDDWVEPQWMESLYCATKEGTIDVVVQNLTVHNIRKEKEYLHAWKLYPQTSPQDALALFWTERHVPRGLHFQISRRGLITKAMSQVYNVNICEDTFALLYLFHEARTAVWLERSYYNYLVVEDGQSLSNRNFKTEQEWHQQRLNIDKIVHRLLASADGHDYSLTTHYIKLRWKRLFKPLFPNLKDYWSLYRDSYRHICVFLRIKGSLKHLKVYFAYNVFYLYRLRNRQY